MQPGHARNGLDGEGPFLPELAQMRAERRKQALLLSRLCVTYLLRWNMRSCHLPSVRKNTL